MFGFMRFDLFHFLFTIIFTLVIGMLIVTAVQGISQWNKNNHSFQLTIPATAVSKRTHVSYHHQPSTMYYVTFEVENGDRMELHVSGSEYGLLMEGIQES